MGIWKKITGIEKIEQARAEEEARLELARKEHLEYEKAAAKKRREVAELEAKEAAEAARVKEDRELAKLSPKEQATKKGEPWVDVLQTHVDENNLRNGFFELDWNNFFVDQLRQAGYGEVADPEEEVVDRWFRDIVGQMLYDEGLDPQSRGAGYINVAKLASGRSEVS